MPFTPEFSFYLEGGDNPVCPGDDVWRSPLPLERSISLERAPQSAAPSTGDYFRALSSFFAQDQGRHLVETLPGDVLAARPQSAAIHIHLVKHGAFYHPALVRIQIGERRFYRAANVAVSTQGKAVIAEEVAALRHLQALGEDLLPRVYGMAENIGPHKMAVFLADWLDGFYEWHFTGGGADQLCRRVVVWDPVHGEYHLSAAQTADLFRRTAAVHTRFYDVASSAHVARWHHGAGDFIIRPAGSAGVDVRLISVRRYAPLVDTARLMPEDLIDTLLLFMVDLTLKNRVDRMDGVGSMALYEIAAVAWTVEGFFEGLTHQVRAGQLPADFAQGFLAFIKAIKVDDIHQLTSALVDRLPAGSEARALYARHCRQHGAALRTAISLMRLSLS